MYLLMKNFCLYNYNTEKNAFCYTNVKKAGMIPLFSEICVFAFAVSLNISFAVTFCLGIPLVVELFASAKSQFHFNVRPAEVKGKWDYGKSFLAHLSVQFHDLSFVHKELTVAQGIAVKNVALLVGADVYSRGEDLAALYLAIGVLEVHLTFPQALYLRAEKLDTRLVFLIHEIIVVRLFVLCDYFSSRVLVSQILTSLYQTKIEKSPKGKITEKRYCTSRYWCG